MADQTFSMIGPDGSHADVPADSVSVALKQGAQHAMQMKGPDGKLAYVPFSSVGLAFKAGAVPVDLSGPSSNNLLRPGNAAPKQQMEGGRPLGTPARMALNAGEALTQVGPQGVSAADANYGAVTPSLGKDWQAIKGLASPVRRLLNRDYKGLAEDAVSQAPAALLGSALYSPLSATAAAESSNVTASIMRKPATAAQSKAGVPGSVRTPLPSILKSDAVDAILNKIIPKGEPGSLTYPGAFDQWYAGKRMGLSPTNAAKLQAQAEGTQVAANPSGNLVMTPAEATAEQQLHAIAKRRAHERGMQFAGGMVPREGRKVPRYPSILPDE